MLDFLVLRSKGPLGKSIFKPYRTTKIYNKTNKIKQLKEHI